MSPDKPLTKASAHDHNKAETIVLCRTHANEAIAAMANLLSNYLDSK